MQRTFYFNGWIYSLSIDLFLKKIRNIIASYALRYDLFPLIDLCCGTGAQGRVFSVSEGLIFGLDLDFNMLVYASSKSPLRPFVCSDISSIPLKDNSLKGIVLSYSVHEKHPDLRHRMISEARKSLIPAGKIIFLDYDPPWNPKSFLAKSYIFLIERVGGREHYTYFQDFMDKGGLTGFLEQENLVEVERLDVDWASSRIIISEFI